MAAVVGVLAVANLFVSDPQTRAVMVPVAAATAAAFTALCAYVNRRPLPDSWAHPVLFTMVIVSALASMLHLYLSGDDRLSSNTMLLVAGAGAFVIDRLWFATSVLGVWIAWGVAISLVPVHDGRLHWILGMVGATLLGVVVGTSRRSAVDRFSELVERAQRAAVEDDLTGLLNRRGLSIVGEQVVASARRAGNAVHCMFVDVDGLKDVNDRHGHLAGDRVLLAVADSVRLSVRSGDVVARWGGDEFCVLGPGPGTSPVELERRIVSRLSELPPDDVPGWRPAVSAGSAMLAPWDDGDLASLLDQADREMYRRRAIRREPRPQPEPQPAPDAD